MKNPPGVRLRAEQYTKADRLIKKTSYSYGVYIRAAVDYFQKENEATAMTQIRETAAMPRARKSSK